jgi:hypothetical protein
MSSLRSYRFHRAYNRTVEQLAELYTYFVDRHDYNSAAWVLHYTSILGVMYDVWRLLTTG